MRSVAALSLLLLAFALLLRLERMPARAPRGFEGELDLLLFARGGLLPVREDPLVERYGLNDGIIADEKVLRFPGGESGLRAALFNRHKRLLVHRNFDLTKTEGIKALLSFVAEVPPNTLLVAQNQGSMLPGDEVMPAHRQSLQVALAGLGAHAQPTLSAPCSWALITLNRETGWFSLGEGYSRNRNITLARSVTVRDWTESTRPGEFVALEDHQEVVVDLMAELEQAQRQGNAWVRPGAKLGEATFNTIKAIPPYLAAENRYEDNRLHWPDIRLGRGARFECQVGLETWVADRSDGVIFQVLLDGQVVVRQEYPTEGGGWTWVPIELSLEPFAGRTVDLELRVSTGPSGIGDEALWAAPTLSWQN